MIDRDHVLHIAKLARLKLSEEEIVKLTRELGSILDYVEQLNQVDTDNIEPTAFVSPEHDPLRDDIEHHSLPPEELLRNGPSVKKGHFAIPKVLGE